MKITLTKLVIGAVAAYVIYKMFFVREGLSNMGVDAITYTIIGVVIVSLFYFWFKLRTDPTF